MLTHNFVEDHKFPARSTASRGAVRALRGICVHGLVVIASDHRLLLLCSGQGRRLVSGDPRGLVENRLRRLQEAQHAPCSLRVRCEGARAAGLNLPEEVAQLGPHLEVGIKYLLISAAMAKEEVLEWQKIELLDLHTLRPAEGEAIILQSACGVWLVGKPKPLPSRRVEEVLQVFEHGKAREGQHFHFGEEVQGHHGGEVGNYVSHGQRSPPRREREGCLRSAQRSEELGGNTGYGGRVH
mmetsp:Transcript_40703/g.86632  ORF Transcript_40703/g.86632 Transcript_40703/m.86632 type:complete len:240 (-) Transcript_40703:1013-1732(-)